MSVVEKTEMKTKNDYLIENNLNKKMEKRKQNQNEQKALIQETFIESGQREEIMFNNPEGVEEGMKLYEEEQLKKKEKYLQKMEELKSDPEKYQKYLEYNREASKKYYNSVSKVHGKTGKEIRMEYHERVKDDEDYKERRRQADKKYKENKGTHKCECGSEVQNLPPRIRKHESSLEHQIAMKKKENPNYVLDSMPEDYKNYVICGGGRRSPQERDRFKLKYNTNVDALPCDLCGTLVQFSKLQIERHFSSKQHLKKLIASSK